MTEVWTWLGDPGHAVNRHGRRLAGAASVRVRPWHAVGRAGRVHLELTDRLLGSTVRAAVASPVLDAIAGCETWVGLHDVPDDGDDDWARTRRPLYARLATTATRTFVASEAEAARLAAFAGVTPTVVPLPVGSRSHVGPADLLTSVTVLGYVWPGRGHDEVVAAARVAGFVVRCVGPAAAGHEHLADALRADDVIVTGWVPELRPWLAAPTIPVAPNRRVSASATIAAWWAHGRRPLVARSAYAEELEARDPRSVLVYDDLAPALLAAAVEPAVTYLRPGVRPGLDVAAAARLRFGR